CTGHLDGNQLFAEQVPRLENGPHAALFQCLEDPILLPEHVAGQHVVEGSRRFRPGVPGAALVGWWVAGPGGGGGAGGQQRIEHRCLLVWAHERGSGWRRVKSLRIGGGNFFSKKKKKGAGNQLALLPRNWLCVRSTGMRRPQTPVQGTRRDRKD